MMPIRYCYLLCIITHTPLNKGIGLINPRSSSTPTATRWGVRETSLKRIITGYNDKTRVILVEDVDEPFAVEKNNPLPREPVHLSAGARVLRGQHRPYERASERSWRRWEGVGFVQTTLMYE